MSVVSVKKPSHGPERHAEAEQAAAQVLEHMRSQGINAEGEASYGRPEEEIVATAVAKNADPIVTGSHGRTGLERVLLGSTSERIINDMSPAKGLAASRARWTHGSYRRGLRCLTPGCAFRRRRGGTGRAY